MWKAKKVSSDKPSFCRVCRRPLTVGQILRHAKRRHPMEYANWITSRLEFGISVFEHMDVKRVAVPEIRK